LKPQAVPNNNSTNIPPDRRQIHGEYLVQGLRWFVHLRWLALAGLLGAIWAGKFWLEVEAGYFALVQVAAAVLGYNVVFSLWSHWLEKRWQEKGELHLRQLEAAAFLQIISDMLAVAAIVHFWGGVENPLLVFFIFHIIIASILFPRSTAYLFALLAAVLSSGVIFLEYYGILPHYHPTGFIYQYAELYQEAGYVLGEALVLALTFFAAAYMGSYIVGYLRRREVELEAARQELMAESKKCELSLSQLEQLHREKSEFMRKVAHELRAPLAAIKSCLEVAREYFPGEVKSKPREMMLRAERRAEGLLGLVQDLLNLSRATEFSVRAAFQKVEMDKIVEGVVELLRPKAEGKGIRLVVELEPAQAVADPQGVEEVVTNLLSNAIKYSPQDTTVEVRLTADAERVRIAVCDQGIGIAPEDKARLFTEFFRAKNAKAQQVEGTGLGLVLTKKIMELHGGSIQVQSTLGEGSTFEVEFPKEPPQAV